MSVKSLIDREYETLTMTDEMQDLITQSGPMTVRLLQRDIQMVQALADFFGKSRSAFGADLLQQAIYEAFTYLTPEDREKLAEKADNAFQGSKGYWSNQAYALIQIDQRNAEKVAA